MYNACDTLRNLPEILEQGLKAQGVSLPIFKLHIPAIAAERSAGTAYLDNRIAVLIKELEAFTGQAFSAAAFLESCELYDKARSLACKLEGVVRSGVLSYGVLCRVLMRGHHLPIEAHLELLMETLALAHEQSAPRGPVLPIMISGILPPSGVLIEAMEQAGFRIVADDNAALYRSYGYAPRPTTDPGAYYRDFYCNHVPCSTLLPTADKRIEHIRQRLASSGARGFIFCGEEFCEYEYFDMPYLEQVLKPHGISTLSLEMGDHEGQSLGTLKNRIETFAELLRKV
jgi:benzoyl-CoA reductase/2-hydroxyglutaryl-CoA dehydratase subunit BcrC/BadD/HgdB